MPDMHAASEVNSGVVEIVSSDERALGVDQTGLARMMEADEAPREHRAFYIEWQQDSHHFCLRWLGDMRLLEVIPAGQPDAFVLRTNRLSCVHHMQYLCETRLEPCLVRVAALASTFPPLLAPRVLAANMPAVTRFTT